jgi:hypothetical protein
MLKTRAYLCQAVTADTSPIFQLASKAFGQARRTVENVFRRSTKVEFSSVRKPIDTAPASRGLWNALHRSSRGLVTSIATKSYQSQLVNAAKRKYPLSAPVGGLFGRVSGFAFVGIGVSAGAKWTQNETHGDFEQNFLFRDDMFGILHKSEVAELPSIDSLPTLCLDEREERTEGCFIDEGRDFEFDIVMDDQAFEDHDGSALQYESFEVIDSELSRGSFERVLGDDVQDYSQEGSSVDGINNDERAYGFSVEEVEALEASCNEIMARIESHHEDITSLHDSLLQINSLLRDWFTTSQVPLVALEMDCEPMTASAEDTAACFDEMQDGKDFDTDEGNELHRSLMLIGSQMRQLRASVYQQNQMVQQAAANRTGSPDFDRTMVMQSTMSRKESCCGPGATAD